MLDRTKSQVRIHDPSYDQLTETVGNRPYDRPGSTLTSLTLKLEDVRSTGYSYRPILDRLSAPSLTPIIFAVEIIGRGGRSRAIKHNRAVVTNLVRFTEAVPLNTYHIGTVSSNLRTPLTLTIKLGLDNVLGIT